DVGHAAGRERDDDSDGLARVLLCEGRARNHERRAERAEADYLFHLSSSFSPFGCRDTKTEGDELAPSHVCSRAQEDRRSLALLEATSGAMSALRDHMSALGHLRPTPAKPHPHACPLRPESGQTADRLAKSA